MGRMHISETEYHTLKALLQMGVRYKRITEDTGRAYNTLIRVFNSPDYETFKIQGIKPAQPKSVEQPTLESLNAKIDRILTLLTK